MSRLGRILLGVGVIVALGSGAFATAMAIGLFTTTDTEPSAPVGRSACAPPFRSEPLPESCWPPYSGESPFNQPVSSQPELASDSAEIIERIISWGPIQNPRLGVADTESDFEHPIYYASQSDPLYTVRCLQWTDGCEIEGHQIHIPEEARPAGGTDGHMAIVDEDAGWEYSLWQSEAPPPAGGTIEISHGGRTRLDGYGLDSNATAAFFGLQAGIIRPQEIGSGEINHALFLTVKCTSGESVPPAEPDTSGLRCDELGEADLGAPPLGARLWLDLTPKQIAEAGVPRWKQTVLTALHRYGGYIGDTMSGDNSIGVRLESGSSYTSFGELDPWITIARQIGVAPDEEGRYALNLDSGIAWREHLHVLAS